MKKLILVAFLVIALCSFSMIITIRNVDAAKPGYNINNYLRITTPVIDGNWTTADEWTDAEEKKLDGSLTVYFRIKWGTVDSTVYNYILVDFVNDTTDDSEDGFSICIDGHHDDGTSPQTDDYRIDLIGHSISGLRVYQGNGTGWEEITTYNWGSDLVIVNNINPSPTSSTPHWIAEIKINSTWAHLLNNFCLRVAAYDASSAAGNQAWPGASTVYVPNDWGATTTMFTQIPEFPSIMLVLIMLIALTPTIYYFKKRFSTKKTITQKAPF